MMVLSRLRATSSRQGTSTSEDQTDSEQPLGRAHGGWIAPPHGHSHIPWDLFQILMKACTVSTHPRERIPSSRIPAYTRLPR